MGSSAATLRNKAGGSLGSRLIARKPLLLVVLVIGALPAVDGGTIATNALVQRRQHGKVVTPAAASDDAAIDAVAEVWSRNKIGSAISITPPTLLRWHKSGNTCNRVPAN